MRVRQSDPHVLTSNSTTSIPIITKHIFSLSTQLPATTMDWRRRNISQFIVLAAAAAYWSLQQEDQTSRGCGRPPAIIRQRRSVEEVYQSLGDRYFRRAYRMSYDSFWALHSQIEKEIKNAIENRRTKTLGSFDPRYAPPVSNGLISTSVRLAVALRYFSGGSPYDLCSVYGISHSSVHESVWIIVDAFNNQKEMRIDPSSHDDQKKLPRDSRKDQVPTLTCVLVEIVSCVEIVCCVVSVSQFSQLPDPPYALFLVPFLQHLSRWLAFLPAKSLPNQSPFFVGR
jgi:hypothetical protein